MYQMTETEYKFAELIWEEEPIGSGELVKQCAEKFGWKKSTTYTFIKKLCENGIFKNENAIVSSVLKIRRNTTEPRGRLSWRRLMAVRCRR